MVVGVDPGLAANRRSTLQKKEHQRLLKSRSARTFGGFSLPAQWPAYAERSAARQNTSNSVITVSWVINQWTVIFVSAAISRYAFIVVRWST